MQIDVDKLSNLINELSVDCVNHCVESSVFIGEIDDNVIRLTIINKGEAIEEHDFTGVIDGFKCMSE